MTEDEKILKAVTDKWGATHEITKVYGLQVILPELPEGVSVCYGDGKSYHFQLKPKFFYNNAVKYGMQDDYKTVGHQPVVDNTKPEPPTDSGTKIIRSSNWSFQEKLQFILRMPEVWNAIKILIGFMEMEQVKKFIQADFVLDFKGEQIGEETFRIRLERNIQEGDEQRVQIISCGKCGAMFSGCTEPECWTDEEYLKELKKHVQMGDKVDMVPKSNFKFESCKCGKDTEEVKQKIK